MFPLNVSANSSTLGRFSVESHASPGLASDHTRLAVSKAPTRFTASPELNRKKLAVSTRCLVFPSTFAAASAPSLTVEAPMLSNKPMRFIAATVRTKSLELTAISLGSAARSAHFHTSGLSLPYAVNKGTMLKAALEP